MDSTGAPALSRVNFKQQSSEIFVRLTSVNEKMPQLLQEMRHFTLQPWFYSTLFPTDSASEIKITNAVKSKMKTRKQKSWLSLCFSHSHKL